MKRFLILIISAFVACNNYPEQGFTNKAEAKNFMKNGLKEGKWLQYSDSTFKETLDSNAPYYVLAVYKADIPYGIVRGFYKSGKLFWEYPYTNGKANGVAKWYYESGALSIEKPYTEGKINGIMKLYYESGKLKAEIPYTNNKVMGIDKDYYENGKLKGEYPYNNGKRNGISKYYFTSGEIQEEDPYIDGKANGVVKIYYASGKLQSETIYTNDIAGATKNYDENGNEINNTPSKKVVLKTEGKAF